MYKDIIWDFDGTLFDTYKSVAEVFVLALSEVNIIIEQEILIVQLKESVTTTIKTLMKTFRLGNEFIVILNKYYKEIDIRTIKPFPEAIEICKLIYENGMNNYLLTHRDNSAIKILEINSIVEYFEGYITAEMGFKRKPDPESLNFIISKYNINIEKAIMIGDRISDIRVANAVGIKSCLIISDDNKSCNQEADYVIRNLEKLYSVLEIIKE